MITVDLVSLEVGYCGVSHLIIFFFPHTYFGTVTFYVNCKVLSLALGGSPTHRVWSVFFWFLQGAAIQIPRLFSL